MGRLLVSGADGNVVRRLVNALAASGDPRRGGDIRYPMRERSPAHLMSRATPGPHDLPVRHVVGSETYARIARPSGEAAQSAAQQRRQQCITE